MTALTKQQLERLAVGDIFTATVSNWIEFTGDVGRYEDEGFGWMEPHCFFKFIEINEAAGTATVRRMK